MSSLSIALSGLSAAQLALKVIGDNIANVNTPGYHRQEAILSHVSYLGTAGFNAGFGVEVDDIRQWTDTYIENSILRNTSLYAQSSREIMILGTIEDLMGEPGDGALNALLTDFFNSWTALSVDPSSLPMRQQTLYAAGALATHLNLLAEAIADKRDSLDIEVDQMVAEVNNITKEIARLNVEIKTLEIGGQSANHLKDRRQQLLLELSEKIGLDIREGEHGDLSVFTGNGWLVKSGVSFNIEWGKDNGRYVLRTSGEASVQLEAVGGQLGGVVRMHNEILPDILNDLDTLTRELITQVNGIHLQGVGTHGSFTSLSGHAARPLDELVPPVQAGTLYIRVTDETTGVTERYAVDIDPAVDDLASVAASLNGVTGIVASAAGDTITVGALSGYTYDFLTTLDPTPNLAGFTGTAVPTISGTYTGDVNETYIFTVAAGGAVGVDSGPAIRVTEASSGAVVGTFSLGADYTPGSEIEVAKGIKVAFSSGTVNAGDDFGTRAFQSSDTSNFLNAVRLNTFFEGSTASNVKVSDYISADITRIATSADGSSGDNENATRMAALLETSHAALQGYAFNEFASAKASAVGQEIHLRDVENSSREAVLEGLYRRRDEVSGVDIDRETIRLLEFQRMYQGMARYLAMTDEGIQMLLELMS